MYRPQKGNLNNTDKVLFTDNFWILIFLCTLPRVSEYLQGSIALFAPFGPFVDHFGDFLDGAIGYL